MARKLKVFRTVAGFNDAYVAATSRKAALAAWGATADLFASGAAEQVTDGALMVDPLARPGEVILKSRGGLAEQLKALGPRNKAHKKTKTASEEPAPKRPSRPPDRSALDRAESALESAVDRHTAELVKLKAERDRIERKIVALQARQAKEIAKLKASERAARDAYRDTLARWSDA